MYHSRNVGMVVGTASLLLPMSSSTTTIIKTTSAIHRRRLTSLLPYSFCLSPQGAGRPAADFVGLL